MFSWFSYETAPGHLLPGHRAEGDSRRCRHPGERAAGVSVQPARGIFPVCMTSLRFDTSVHGAGGRNPTVTTRFPTCVQAGAITVTRARPLLRGPPQCSRVAPGRLFGAGARLGAFDSLARLEPRVPRLCMVQPLPRLRPSLVRSGRHPRRVRRVCRPAAERSARDARPEHHHRPAQPSRSPRPRRGRDDRVSRRHRAHRSAGRAAPARRPLWRTQSAPTRAPSGAVSLPADGLDHTGRFCRSPAALNPSCHHIRARSAVPDPLGQPGRDSAGIPRSRTARQLGAFPGCGTITALGDQRLRSGPPRRAHSMKEPRLPYDHPIADLDRLPTRRADPVSPD